MAEELRESIEKEERLKMAHCQRFSSTVSWPHRFEPEERQNIMEVYVK